MFYHRLALALGRTVEELLAGTTAPALTRWQAYYRSEPFGEWRDDLRMALICVQLAAVWGNKGEALNPARYMPNFGGESSRSREKKSAETLKIAFAVHAAATQAGGAARHRPEGGAS